MLKQIISPQFAKADIVNSKMPEVFFDPTAKQKIYLYKTNQQFDQIFINEDDDEQRIVQYQFEQEIDVWIGQNLAKQINPYQGSSAAKTIAMQTEIELYLFKDFRNQIEKTLYFFTFEPLTDADVKKIPKFIVKESTPNFDKDKFRFSRIKAWQMSSVLFKQYNYWIFQKTASTNRTKIKRMIIRFDASSLFGNLRIEHSKVIGAQPQEADYKLSSIIHPFDNIEPVAVNFSYKSGSLYYQLVNWDLFGYAIEKTQSHKFGGLETDLTKSKTMAFEKKKYGCVKWLAGAIIDPDAPTGDIYGLAEAYMANDDIAVKNGPNDLKAYIYGVQITPNLNQREYWDLKKCSPVNSMNQFESFLRFGNVTINFSPWWNAYDDDYYGDKFYSVNYSVLSAETFEISNKLITSAKDAGGYCWCLGGAINFYNKGIFAKRTAGKETWTNASYYSFGTTPWNFLSNSQIIRILNGQKTNSSLNQIMLTIDFDDPIWLNKMEFNVLLADKLEIKIIDVNDIQQEFEVYTSYFFKQDQPTTVVTFF